MLTRSLRKKISYYLLTGLLTVGASLIIGLMSFSGLYALITLWPVAVAALLLSITYEAEIYRKNIKAALSKLFSKNTLLSNAFLLANFPEASHNRHPFFNNYAQILAEFNS